MTTDLTKNARRIAELAEEQRISTERGNHIELELLPQMADLTMRVKELEAELTAAREQVAGAYLAAALRCNTEGLRQSRLPASEILLKMANIINSLTPAYATAALESRIQRERAEERAKVIEEVAETYKLARRSYWGVTLAQWEGRFMKNLDALHTEASREVK